MIPRSRGLQTRGVPSAAEMRAEPRTGPLAATIATAALDRVGEAHGLGWEAVVIAAFAAVVRRRLAAAERSVRIVADTGRRRSAFVLRDPEGPVERILGGVEIAVLPGDQADRADARVAFASAPPDESNADLLVTAAGDGAVQLTVVDSVTCEVDRDASERLVSTLVDVARRATARAPGTGHPDTTARLVVPHYPPVTRYVAEAVGRWPERVALEVGARRHTYEELAFRADEFAAVLRGAGVAPGVAVSVTGAPSFGTVVALLGVLQAGAVAVPIDARLPEAQRRAFHEVARVRYAVLIGDGSGGVAPGPTVAVNEAEGTAAGARATATFAELTASAPAYVFFTSGTTAAPAGVLGRHDSLAHFVVWQGDEYGVGPGDRVAHLTGLSFDVVLRELFLPLTTGATLCIPEQRPIARRHVLRWLAEEAITVVHVVPTLAREWLRATGSVELGPLRLTFFAGEALTDTLVAAWRERAPSAAIVNLYGPTETTLAKFAYRVPERPRTGVQPVGLALPQTHALVLDRDGRLCQGGEVGEIVIRTAFGTHGYLAPAGGRGGFRSNPFTGEPGDVVYFTGDLGYRDDASHGVLVVVGRRDQQVKVRGVRVDPRQVQAALETHPQVAAAAVVVGSRRGGPRLVAYAVLREPEPEPGELREHLLRYVGTAALPAEIHPVDSLPVTANGKLDVAALVRIARPRGPRGDAGRRPTTSSPERRGRSDEPPARRAP